MLNKRIINTGADACTTDTTQILDAGSTQSKALYRLEDNVNDTANSTGKFGKAAIFNGSNSVITLPSALSDGATTVANCISFWFNVGAAVTSSTTNNEIMQFAGTSSVTGKITLGSTSGYMSGETFAVTHNVSGVYTYSKTNIPAGWNHAVVQWNSSDGKWDIYINNVKHTTYTVGTNAQGYWKLKFGERSTFYYAGSLDQIRIFNKILSTNEIATLYNETTSTVNTLQVLGDTSCVATYTFEGNANDLSTNYNGTASNVRYDYSGTASNVTYTTGKFGKAIEFNGSTGFMNVENMSAVLANDFTVSMWIKTPSSLATSGYPTFISLYGYPGSGSAYGWSIEYVGAGASSKFMFYWVSASHQGNSIQSGTISANTWYHVLVKKNSSSASLYINGQLDHSGGTSINSYGMYYSTITDLTFGAKRLTDGGSISSQFTGLVDQVRLFTTQLGEGEINSLYNETATSAASGTIDNPSTTAYYKMADATDETGSYNGTATNVNFNVQGKYGFAGKFNGSSSKIDLGNNSSNNSSIISVSLWFKTAGHSGTATLINNGGANSGETGYYLGLNSNGTIKFEASTGTINGSVNYADNNWHHIALTLNSGSYNIYVDGNTTPVITGSGAFTGTATRPTWIGQLSYTASNIEFFNGLIDQVRIFNKAISASEVTTLYNEVQCANTIDTPESYFKTKTFASNNGTQSITGLGFKPDLVWTKSRTNAYNHSLYDSIRGVNKLIQANTTNAQSSVSNAFNSFDSDGFTLGSGDNSNSGSGNSVAWAWKAASSNTTNNDGTDASTVRASQESGFSIVSLNKTGTTTNTYGHGLGAVPELIILKRTVSSDDWYVYHKDLGNSVRISLNSSAAKVTGTGVWGSTNPTSSIFTLQNQSGGDHIAYCFANVDGYQRISSYIGNGSANGPFVYTGFEPAFVLIKRTDSARNWRIIDNKRSTTNPRDKEIYPNLSNADGTYNSLNFHTNGFQVINTDISYNASGGSYIFLAIAANPDTTAPTKANSFKTVLYNGTGSSQSITGTGFKPDLTWIKNRANGVTNSWHTITDSVRGGGTRVWPNATNAEAADNYDVLSFQNDGFTIGTGTYSSYNGGSFVSWNWKGSDHDRNLATINNSGTITSLVSANPAAGFSVVKWTGTGVDGTKIGHELQGSPEMIITKGLSNATSWVIGVGNISGLSINDYFTFTSYAKANSSTFYQAYSTDTFQVGVSAANEMNKSSSNQYISYCFRTISGHSKVGKYTGTGVSGLEVTLDFSPSFLLVKGAGATGWIIIDNQRPTPGGNYELYPNLSNTEDTSATSFLLGTNKFTVNSTGTWHNTNGTDYIYLAIK